MDTELEKRINSLAGLEVHRRRPVSSWKGCCTFTAATCDWCCFFPQWDSQRKLGSFKSDCSSWIRETDGSPHHLVSFSSSLFLLALGCRKCSIWCAGLQILCHSFKRAKPAMHLHTTIFTLQGRRCSSSDSISNCLCVQWGGRLSLIVKTGIVSLGIRWQMPEQSVTTFTSFSRIGYR